MPNRPPPERGRRDTLLNALDLLLLAVLAGLALGLVGALATDILVTLRSAHAAPARSLPGPATPEAAAP